MNQLSTNGGLLKFLRHAQRVYLDNLLSNNQAYRRSRGGKWFQVEDQSSAWGGKFWVREVERDAFSVEICREDWG